MLHFRVEKAFYKDFSSTNDFLKRAILEPKGLQLESRQKRVGVGDVSLFGLFDFADYFNCIDGWQIGLNVTFPTGNKRTEKKIWEVELGNGGATQFDLFSTIIFNSRAQFFNPAITIGGQLSRSFVGWRRIPKLKEQEEAGLVQDNPNILAPVCSEFTVQPFSCFDSTIAEFADSRVCTRIKYGHRVFASLGNYFYDIFKTCMPVRLGLFYNVEYKKKDKVVCIVPTDCTPRGQFDTCLLEKCTDELSHAVSWNLGWQFPDSCEFNFDSQHVVSGKNVAKSHDIFVSLVAVF